MRSMVEGRLGETGSRDERELPRRGCGDLRQRRRTMVVSTEVQSFTQQIRRRSREHARAIDMIAKVGLVAPAVSILRQEVDSLVRVIFLLAQPSPYREDLIRASINGERWLRPNGRSSVTDREMVDLSTRLIGWTQSVYKFGCAFVHLSNLHNYDVNDPLAKLPGTEREDILRHMRYYHGGPKSDHPTLDDLLPFIPKVLKNISDNLEYYLEQLEAGFNPELEEI